jgi:hypothetical protein
MAGAGDSRLVGAACACSVESGHAPTLVALPAQWLHPSPRSSGVLPGGDRDVCRVAIGEVSRCGRSVLYRGAAERLYVRNSRRLLISFFQTL